MWPMIATVMLERAEAHGQLEAVMGGLESPGGRSGCCSGLSRERVSVGSKRSACGLQRGQILEPFVGGASSEGGLI